MIIMRIMMMRIIIIMIIIMMKTILLWHKTSTRIILKTHPHSRFTQTHNNNTHFISLRNEELEPESHKTKQGKLFFFLEITTLRRKNDTHTHKSERIEKETWCTRDTLPGTPCKSSPRYFYAHRGARVPLRFFFCLDFPRNDASVPLLHHR